MAKRVRSGERYRNRDTGLWRGSPLEKAVAFHSVKVGECVFWKHHWGRTDVPPTMRWEGKVQLVSRLVWSDKHGPIPRGRPVLQRCKHRGCIRLEHLKLGTRKGGRKGNG